ncbi:PspA/IM30 family protein [Ferrimonas kyonanensis]|uniref:PspA/IM30 family protein n=1 Tax=Ferrimonas kyonanensis TaxID=364763 RepID=UPI0003FFB29A|nr:PspA/IM30 family protein [Ferrimonas kyonanensis]
MNEGIFSRIGRLVTASANSLVDSMEDAAPEMAMEGAIAEMEQAVDELRLELGKLEAAKHLTAKQYQQASAEHDQLAESLTAALDAGRDDLAEVAIARQMDIEAQLPVLQRLLSEKSDQLTETQGYIDALLAKRREMLNALNDFREAQKQSSQSVSGQPQATTPTQSAEQSERAFNKILSRQTGVRQQGAGKDHQKLAELESLARKSAIAQRLAKAKLAAED